jgi:hypothetical protein
MASPTPDTTDPVVTNQSSTGETTAEERTCDTDDKGRKRDYEIVINGTKFVVEDEVVTYQQVVALGFPNGELGVKYSVAYRKARGGHGGTGTLAPDTSVTVKEKGTSFDVTPTTRS